LQKVPSHFHLQVQRDRVVACGSHLRHAHLKVLVEALRERSPNPRRGAAELSQLTK